MSFFQRNPIPEECAKKVCAELQTVLVTLIDLSLVAKQAHWNVFGEHFLSVHEKLDEVVESARTGSDTIAERMVQLGHAADGRAATVASSSPIEKYPEGFVHVDETLKQICDRLLAVSTALRTAIESVSEHDPLTEDQLIAIGQEVEEHLWMLQAMAKKS